jgi:hypothetical protein
VKKRIQNKTAESRRTLPIAMLYGTAIWVLAGLFQEQWWMQFACFIMSVLLVMRINSKNLLIRIYSRSVSVAFIFLSCAAVFLFPSWTGGIVQLCYIAALMLLFDSYQDQTTVGNAYYTFLLLGISSMFDANILFYLLLQWIMMRIIVYSLSWRTFFASLLGLATPYWFMSGWLMWQKNGDLHAIASLFAVQDILQFPLDFSSVPLSYQLIMAFATLLMLIGSIHFIHTSYRDKIRVRQIYYGFITLGLFSLTLLVLQPHNELALRMLILAASPLIGHYWALTNSRISNIIFIIITVAIVALTAYNLWISSSVS